MPCTIFGPALASSKLSKGIATATKFSSRSKSISDQTVESKDESISDSTVESKDVSVSFPVVLAFPSILVYTLLSSKFKVRQVEEF